MISIAVSLITRNNDYQREQAAAAEEAARRLGIKLQILYGNGDAIEQGQQLLQIIQVDASLRPNGIICESAGTGLAQVARAASAAKIGWGILNRDVDYIADLRRTYNVPVFAVSADNVEIGRIQGGQISALLPQGGVVLLIQGPSMSSVSQHRMEGLNQTKTSNVQFRILKAQWTEESAYASVSSWLRLSTSHQIAIGMVVAQNDSMALGARKAFESETSGAERERFLNLPYIGCDGVPSTGQAWVRTGQLTATVVIPPNTGPALEMMVRALQTGIQPPEQTQTVPRSFPEIDKLTAIAQARR